MAHLADGADESRRSFTERLWAMDEKALIQHYIVAKREGDAETARAILQAKSLLASEEAARAAKESTEASRDVASKTGQLAWATIGMAFTTLVMAVVTTISLLR